MSKYAKLTPHLTVSNGLEAIKFYEEAFDADVGNVMMAEDGKRVMHAELEVNDAILFLCDHFPEYDQGMLPPAKGGASVTIHMEVKRPKHVDAMIAQAAVNGAEITMPAQDVFWGARYGRVRDPFGHVWSVGAPLKRTDKDKDGDR